MLQEDEYDLVLMDVQMPVMDGYEATQRIRSNPRWTNLPVIAMTAHAMSEHREKSLQAGMNDQINKPVNPDELLETISQYTKTSVLISSGQLKQEGDNPEELPWPDLPGINLVDGLARVNGNRQLYKKILLQFSANNVDTVYKIKFALSKGDHKTASLLLHTVKGVAANLGAGQLASAAAELEASLIQRGIDVNNVLLKNFIESLTSVIEGIKSFEEMFASEPNGNQPEPIIADVNVDIVRPLMITLARLLESGSIKSVQQLDVLGSYLTNTRVNIQFQQLRKSVDIFDMDRALDQLKEIAAALEISL